MADKQSKELVLNTRTSKAKIKQALKSEIEKIDAELSALGVDEVKYKIPGTITNFESPQNTVNIDKLTMAPAVRILAYYKVLYKEMKLILKDVEGSNEYKESLMLSSNGYRVSDIIHDLELRIKILTHGAKITALKTAREELMPFVDEDTRLVNTLKKVQQLYKTF